MRVALERLGDGEVAARGLGAGDLLLADDRRRRAIRAADRLVRAGVRVVGGGGRVDLRAEVVAVGEGLGGLDAVQAELAVECGEALLALGEAACVEACVVERWRNPEDEEGSRKARES